MHSLELKASNAEARFSPFPSLSQRAKERERCRPSMRLQPLHKKSVSSASVRRLSAEGVRLALRDASG